MSGALRALAGWARASASSLRASCQRPHSTKSAALRTTGSEGGVEAAAAAAPQPTKTSTATIGPARRIFVRFYNERGGMRILLVEDEHKVAQFIKKGLQQGHFAVDLAADGEEALYLAEASAYDLIILDLMLPKVSGFSVLSTVRKRTHNVPILILTAKTSVEDRVRGLEIGSDDYLIKPFAFAELRARV